MDRHRCSSSGFPRPRPAGLLLLLAFLQASAPAADWPAWRGPFGDGRCLETNAPTRWSRTENVRWRTALPGPGNSTPIVWGDRIFITQASADLRGILAFDRRTGRVLWSRGLKPGGREPTHRQNPLCSSSPVTDGERVIAWLGSSGLVAFDFNGSNLWHTPLGPQRHRFGYGSSPVLDGDRVYLNFGPGENEFVVALDKRTGREIWRVTSPVPPADDIAGTWSTPFLTEVNGAPQLLIALRDYFAGVVPASGRVIWHARGLGPQAKASPIAGEGVALISGDSDSAELAIRLGGSGDVSETHLLWREVPPRGRVGTGVIRDGHIYGVRANGIIDCVELETGDVVWAERQRGAGANTAVWSSPVLVGDLLYIMNQAGETVICRAEPQFRQVAINSVGEVCNASPVVAYGDLFIRTWAALWCIRGGD